MRLAARVRLRGEKVTSGERRARRESADGRRHDTIERGKAEGLRERGGTGKEAPKPLDRLGL